jgi:CRISPR-associated protein Cas2
MAMTVVVTRNVADRFRGFLASCMCELAPGVYLGPRMNQATRDRVWRVLRSWFPRGSDCSIVMVWPDRTAVGGQSIRVLGVPRTDVADVDGIFLTRRELTSKQHEELAAAPFFDNEHEFSE